MRSIVYWGLHEGPYLWKELPYLRNPFCKGGGLCRTPLGSHASFGEIRLLQVEALSCCAQEP